MESHLKDKLKPIMEDLVYRLVQNKPEKPTEYMLEYLLKKEGYTANGITHDEKKELEQLRKEITKYRQLQEETKKEEGHNSNDDSMTDEEDDVDDQIEHKVRASQQRLSKQREAVSAEAYGVFNVKSEFTPKVIAKTEEQIQRIKVRVLQSFLFSALEGKDLSIVIGAMEEKHFSAGEYVINQGENGEVLYVVESGELDCYKKFVSFIIVNI